jgi:hypothetical protein
MKTYEHSFKTAQSFRGAIVPMFAPVYMEQPMAEKATTQPQQTELSLLDVKELYDRAYEEKAKDGENSEKFKKILAEAVKLDLAYRRQLARNASYKEPSKMKSFDKAKEGNSKGTRVA